MVNSSIDSISETPVRRNPRYQAMRQAVLSPFANLFALLTNSSTPQQPVVADDNAENILLAEKRYETVYDGTAAKFRLQRSIREIPDDLAERLMDRLIDLIVSELGPRAKDALLGLESRDPLIAKAERDANQGTPMNCFINIGGVFVYLVDYIHTRYPRDNTVDDDILLAYNPFCSLDLNDPESCLTDNLEQSENGPSIDWLVSLSAVSMSPLIWASFLCMKAGMPPYSTPLSPLNDRFHVYLHDNDRFEILDGLDGVKEAFEAYQYFDDQSDPITLTQFIDQVALSQIIWSLARLFGRPAIDALDRLQEKKGKYFLRFATTDISHGDFDLTDPRDSKAKKIGEMFARMVGFRY